MAVSANRVPPRLAWLWAAAGALAGLAHLSRPDGLLFLGISVLFVLVLAARTRRWAGLLMLAPVLASYALVLLPWGLRNLQTLGTLLPTGGAEGMFFVTYDDLFAYPAGASLGRFLDTLGWQGFLSTRWDAVEGGDGAISGNLGTFIAVEGMIFLAPFMLIGLFKRLRQPFLWPFFAAVMGIHAVMTLIFPFAGYRGGLLHSAGALVPFWAALGVVGVQDVINWVARRRRNWRPASAIRVFGPALILFAVLLIVALEARHVRAPSETDRALYAEVDALLPDDARLLSVDPPEVYYVSGRGGASIPNAAPDVLPELAARFDIRYLLLQEGTITEPMTSAWDAPPEFLRAIPLTSAGARLYEITAAPSGRP
ncbi:MAG TPA: hypothetical protein VER79_02955, partial [Candidatus Limnocylindrales bacterium]|nr:hypothetical protein [Candidatus Limnocylindrales bacterium]